MTHLRAVLATIRSEIAAALECWSLLCEHADERKWVRTVKNFSEEAERTFIPPGRWVDYTPKALTAAPFVRVENLPPKHPLEAILERLEAAKPSAAILSMTGGARQ